MRVAVADDGELFREGLVLLLGEAGHDVLGSLTNGDALLALANTEPLDVAVLDIRMPPGEEGGLSTAHRLREHHPDLALLVLSQYTEAHYLHQLLAVGTRGIGYRLKDRIAGLDTLNDTLARLVEGEMVIEPEVAQHLVSGPGSSDSPLSALGDRERDVLRLMAEGRSNRSIADALFVSSKAVEKHTASIFGKLGLPEDATSYHRRVLAVLAYLQHPA